MTATTKKTLIMSFLYLSAVAYLGSSTCCGQSEITITNGKKELEIKLPTFPATEGAKEADGDFAWPQIATTHRPWTYWHWMGSAVDEENLSKLLEMYSEAGLGGVHIIPIYGVKGWEDKFIDYLSDRWLNVLSHTVSEAKRLGMGVDMTTGTGWNFGGPTVSKQDANFKVRLEKYTVEAGSSLDESFAKQSVLALTGYSHKGGVVNLTDRITCEGKLDWTPRETPWQLYAVIANFKRMKKVERAAPGGAGYQIDPFSKRALENYLPRFQNAFSRYTGPLPRAHYHDSYEYSCNWSRELFEQFRQRRGYDLRERLDALFGDGNPDIVARVKADYRWTASDMLHDNLIVPWVRWCHRNGFLTRNQAHGSPANILDLYAAADIPETEIFRRTGFDIPQLRVDPDSGRPDNDLLMLKFASSAAHVAGRRLVSSETCTWLGEHFKVALSQAKPEIDHLFIAGINHVFYHGTTYSPLEEKWPGWLFYASTNFAPSNPFWRDFPQLNTYIARCQSILQAGRADNEVLLYFPIHDIWHNPNGMLRGFSVHNASEWLGKTEFYKTAALMRQKGYCFDYISDRQIGKTKCVHGAVATPGGRYKTIVVPGCRFMPVETLKNIRALAESGATVIMLNAMPQDVPGLADLQKRREVFRGILTDIKFVQENTPFCVATVGGGRVLMGEGLAAMLNAAGVVRETLVDKGLDFIRCTHRGKYHYFITNLGPKYVDGWVELARAAGSVAILDSLSGRTGIAAVRKTGDGKVKVYLQLKPGQSVILRTFNFNDIRGEPWRYQRPAGKPMAIEGQWKVEFIEGGPVLPEGFQTKCLASWTESGGIEARRFAGTALYKVVFDRPFAAADEWMLNLGKVCESARVRINGHDAGTAWCIPFELPAGQYLKDSANLLEVEVTNLAANRIADLDRRRVNWRKFYEINFVNINYEKFDASDWPPMESGLPGPVRLVPMKEVSP